MFAFNSSQFSKTWKMNTPSVKQQELLLLDCCFHLIALKARAHIGFNNLSNNKGIKHGEMGYIFALTKSSPAALLLLNITDYRRASCSQTTGKWLASSVARQSLVRLALA